MEILHKTKNIQEVLNCIHEAVVHQWDKYTLRDVLKAGIPQPCAQGDTCALSFGPINIFYGWG